MKTMLALSGQKRLRICGWFAACAMAATSLGAQTPVPRIQSEINYEMSQLKGSLNPMAQAQSDAGRMPSNARLTGMSIFFSRSAAQQADLQALIAAQQNPASPLFHQWLTPDQFGARFGMAQTDIDKVQTWLQQQGFSIDSVARSKTMIRFSGSVGQVEQAFQTQMHYYNVGGTKHFAPSTALSLPTAIAPVVAAVRNLDNFRPRSMHIPNRTRPAFTSSQSSSVFFAPGDIKTAYDVPTSSTGVGQSIAVVGQSAVNVSDIENFQTASGLTVKDPTMVLVPGTGSSTVVSGGDEGESDLDLEWSGAMAPGADIYFVYVGNGTDVNNNSYSIFDSIQYAVDERIANIITISYGACEAGLTSSGATALENIMQQATTQGQTVISASGDEGSSACFISNPAQTGDPTLTVQESLAVNYPASSQYVTGVGGTEITSADDKVGTYWLAASGSDQINSVTKYIPEVAWNDDAYNIQQACTSTASNPTSCLSASGGGASSLFGKPTWQAGPGVPADSKRDVPDVSLYSSASFPGYLYCTGDQADWSPASNGQAAQAASCSNGTFRDLVSGGNYLTVAGGTSFAAPIFAGMVAIINQTKGYTAGQGLINPTLYSMAANSATYTAAFNDITTGNNECTAGSIFCSSTSGTTTHYTTTTGYDQATGLGSVNLSALATAWAPTVTVPTLTGTTTTVSASNNTPAVGASVTFTITVAAGASPISTGNVTLQIDGGGSSSYGTGMTATAALTANGTATYTTSFATGGTHQVIAQYAGDSTKYAASTGLVQVAVGGSTSGGTFTLAATPSTLTVSQGSQGSETIAVTPTGGYSGTVYLSFTSTNSSALTNLCYGFTTMAPDGSSGSVAVSGTSAATTKLVLDTNASDCVSNAGNGYGYGYGYGYKKRTGLIPMHKMQGGNTSRNNGPNPAPAGLAFAGLLLAGFLGRYSKKFRALAGVIALVTLGLSISACGGVNNGVSNPSKGTYTVTVTGKDSVNSAITNTTKFTFVID